MIEISKEKKKQIYHCWNTVDINQRALWANSWINWRFLFYCAFHKHANSNVQNPPSQLRFSLPSIIITITRNEPWNTETHKTDRNPPITNHKPWPYEPVKVKFCFLRGPLRWLTAAKNAIVSWHLNFSIRMFVKSAVRVNACENQTESKKSRPR